jgi:formate-nitrite transporter family protein
VTARPISMRWISLLPEVRATVAALGRHYPTLGVSWRSLMLAILSGGIALVTSLPDAAAEYAQQLL